MTEASASPATVPSPFRWSRLCRIVLRAAAVVLSVALVYVAWWLYCRAFVPRTLDTTRGGVPFRVGWQNIVVLAAVFSLAGWAVLAGLERLNPSEARRRFFWLGLIVLLASMLLPWLEHSSMATRLFLSGTHVLVAIPVLSMSLARGRDREAAPGTAGPSSVDDADS